jgi:GT2 family glycosyltransferase
MMERRIRSFAILMTCYNRAQTTVGCLGDLFACTIPSGWEFDVYLVDDASPDHTGALVAKRFPVVRIIPGTGSLYWSGGTRLAWDTAAGHAEYDAFVWLNDDTRLYPGGLVTLAETAREVAQRVGKEAIIVGATADPVSKKTTYGALATDPADPEGAPRQFRAKETMNGNVVWVPRTVWQRLGNLRAVYTHAMADTDYGLRAQKRSIPVWLTPEYVGSCPRNKTLTWTDPTIPLVNRVRALHSPKGCRPSEYVHIARLMHPWTWPLHLLNLYRRVAFPK